MAERICSKCGVLKPETEEFFRRRGTPDRGGLRPDCRDCSAARDRAYYQDNLERERLKRADYRARTKAQAQVRYRAWAQTPAGKAARRRAVLTYSKTDAGRLTVVQSQQRRRAAKSGVGADLTKGQWISILDWFGHECAYCGSAGGLTQEHVVALAQGGRHTLRNVVPACVSCNSRKFVTEMETWFRTQAFFNADRLARIQQHLFPEAA